MWVGFNCGTIELLIRAYFLNALLETEANWEKDLWKGVIRTSLRIWLLPNEMLSSWEMREAGSSTERLLFLFSLAVSCLPMFPHISEVVSGHMSCVSCTISVTLNDGRRVDDLLSNEWFQLGCIHASMHPFIHFPKYLLTMHHVPIAALVGGSGREDQSRCLLDFLLPWEQGIFPYLMKITFWDSGCDVTFW